MSQPFVTARLPHCASAILSLQFGHCSESARAALYGYSAELQLEQGRRKGKVQGIYCTVKVEPPSRRDCGGSE